MAAGKLVNGYLQSAIYYKDELTDNATSRANIRYVICYAKAHGIKIETCQLNEFPSLSSRETPPLIILAYDMFFTLALFFHAQGIERKFPDLWGKMQALEQGQLLDKDLLLQAEREAVFDIWKSNPGVKRTVAALLVRTQMVSEEKAWEIINQHWGSDKEMFAHFQDPETRKIACEITDDNLVEINTDLNDRVSAACFTSVMHHLLDKAGRISREKYNDGRQCDDEI
jgi:hypothetical protein